MKKFFALIFAVSALPVSAATSPSYENNSPITFFDRPPQIDATVFVNRSTFEVSTALPFQAQNVQFWTNNAAMNGLPGFRFEQDGTGRIVTRRGRKVRIKAPSRNLQLPSSVFYNDGNISSSTLLLVNATNIYHSGRMDGLESCKINLLSANGTIDLARGGIRVGTATGLSSPCGFFSVSSNFTADGAIVDQYWGAGRNNDLGTNGAVLNLIQLASGSGSFFQPSLNLPFPRSASHEVILPSGSRTFTNTVFLPLFGCSDGYTAYMHTNFNNATSMVVNVVFVPTNSLLSPGNLSVDVRFVPNSGRAGNAYAPVIEFRSADFDIVDQQFATNYFTFIDASAAQTNITLARPLFLTGVRRQNIRRPSTYTWIRGRYCNFDFTNFAEVANATYDPSIFYNANFRTNTANTIYAADQVSIGAANQTVTTLPLGTNPRLTDPTNFAGTITINAKQLNLENSRIRAQDFIGIRTQNLISNSFAQLDAPFIDFDVRSTNSLLVISNIAPTSVSRIFGTMAAWSSVWNAEVLNTNLVSTQLNLVRFHVTLVENCLQSAQPVTMHRFSASAPNLVISDQLSINAGLKIEAGSLTVQSNGGLNLPLGANFAFTNVNKLLNFTNDGFINVPGAAFFGTFQAGHIISKKVPALDNFVNRGSISAASIFVRSTNVQIESSFFPATLIANGGLVAITASDLALTNAAISASSDVELHGNALRLENSFITAGSTNLRGTLIIDATNSLGDAPGVLSPNLWLVNSGVRLLRRPAEAGDLLGTQIRSTANRLVVSTITWAGDDLGAVPEGFANNLALGRLTLGGAGGNLFRFRSATGGNALYVDYLELLNDATNFNFAVGVDTDFTIYFGDSNINPEKLDNGGGGRIRWVRDFAGPQSSASIVYPNGITYTFNAGLLRSKDIDSDGDGIVNLDDCSPIQVPGYDTTQPCPGPDLARTAALSTQNVGLSIVMDATGSHAVLNWNAPAGASSTVEFSESLTAGSWQTLTNVINGPVEARVTVKDAVGVPLRVYRVRVDADKP